MCIRDRPLIDYYTKEGILKSVDGTKDLEEVFADIVAILGAVSYTHLHTAKLA